MTHCNTFNVKLSTSQLNKLKSWIKNGTEVILKISSNVVSDSNDVKLSLTNTQVPRLREAFYFFYQVVKHILQTKSNK